MRSQNSNLVLAYQRADDQRRESSARFWGDIAEVFAYSVVWGLVGVAAAALVGSVVLWGVLLATAAQ